MPETPTPEQKLVPLDLVQRLQAEIERLQALLDSHGRETLDALREVVRLRLATDEGSLRVRADRMWEIARQAIAKAEAQLADPAHGREKEPPPLWRHAIEECNAAHRALDAAGVPPTTRVRRVRGPLGEDQDVTLGLADRIRVLADPAHGRERDEIARLREQLAAAEKHVARQHEMLYACHAVIDPAKLPQLDEWIGEENEWCETRFKELQAALADRPQGHSKDCAVWLGTSANPESPPLECDCGLAQQGRGQDSTPTLTVQGLDNIGQVLEALRAAGYQITDPPADAVVPSSGREQEKTNGQD